MSRILWVNNVPQIVGGTLNCTHSMCQALPEHQHTVWAVRGQFGEEEHRAFEGIAELTTEGSPREYDVVVYQNSALEWISHGPKTKAVYYQHSASSTSACRDLCDHVFYVSQWLKNKDRGQGVVLHQPVTIPKILDFGTRQHGVVIGRICTPTETKWIPNDFLPHLVLAATVPNTYFEFVGCPRTLQSRVADAVQGRATFRNPGFSSRSLLRNWKVLLYNSSQHETFGRTVREAQRSGCVPIVSNHSGLAEQIEHGKSGFLVDSPEDTKKAIIQAMADPFIKSSCKAFGDLHGSLAGWAEKFKGIVGL